MQFGSTSVGRIIAAVLQGISLILIARALSPTEFGLISSVLGASLVAQTVFDLGLSVFIAKERAVHPESGMVTSALQLNNRLSLALFAVSILTLGLLGSTVNGAFWLMAPLAVWMSADRNSETWLSVVFSDGDWRINFTNLVSKRILALLGFIALQLIGVTPILAFSAAWALTSALSSFAARWYVKYRLPPAANMNLRSIMKVSWPYWLNSLSTQAGNLDVGLASFAGGAFQGGIFATATRLTSPLRILPTSLAKALLPAASRSVIDGSRRHLLQLSTVMFIGMACVYACMFFLTPAFLPNVLGEQYRPAVGSLQIVFVGLPFAAGSSLLGAILQGTGHSQYVAHVALVTTAMYLVTLVFIIDKLGANGAAMALSGSYLLQFALSLFRVFQTERRSTRASSATASGSKVYS